MRVLPRRTFSARPDVYFRCRVILSMLSLDAEAAFDCRSTRAGGREPALRARICIPDSLVAIEIPCSARDQEALHHPRCTPRHILAYSAEWLDPGFSRHSMRSGRPD